MCSGSRYLFSSETFQLKSLCIIFCVHKQLLELYLLVNQKAIMNKKDI